MTRKPEPQLVVTLEVKLEGPAREVGEKLAALIKLMPREQQIEALRQVGARAGADVEALIRAADARNERARTHARARRPR